jgi:hypothetical protein
VTTLGNILTRIPSSNRGVISRLFTHWHMVGSFEPQNKMSYRNIATVVAPAILYPKTDRVETLVKKKKNFFPFLFFFFLMGRLKIWKNQMVL